MFCNRNSPVIGSGDGSRRSHAPANSAHSDGTCDSTPIRARTSSPRLVSCVLNAVIASRPQRAAHGGPLMEFGEAHPEAVGFAADFVQRHQPRVAVEQAVLHRLGGRRSTQLLQAHRRFAAVSDCRGDHREWFGQILSRGDGFGQCDRKHRRQAHVVGSVHADVAQQLGDGLAELRMGPAGRGRDRRGTTGPARCAGCR